MDTQSSELASEPLHYKPSMFNARSTGTDGKLVLYNSFTGRICVIPERGVARALKTLRRSGCSAPLDGLGVYLRDNGYIVPSDFDEFAVLDERYDAGRNRSDTLHLIIMPTYQCNFRCVYCAQHFRESFMQPPIVDAVRALLLKRAPDLRYLMITWFGGEPLLAWPVIETLSPFIKDLAAEHKITLMGHMTTNGYLMSSDRFHQLVQWGIVDYQITVDGCNEEHDKKRPLLDGSGTFDRIIDNVIAMKSNPGRFRVVVRVNVDNENTWHLHSLFNRLGKEIGNDERFGIRFRPVGRWGGPNDADLDVCAKPTEHIRRLRAEAVAEGLFPEMAEREMRGEQVCYAGRSYSYVIGPRGELMKCTVALDSTPINLVGQLRSDGTLDINRLTFDRWTKAYYREDKQCRSCFMLPVCLGGSCPTMRLQNGKRPPCREEKVHIQSSLMEAWASGRTSGTYHTTMVRVAPV